MQIRTRFAPSPTGALHIGSVRTALFAWLYARRFGGQFILRIENTDVERSTEESVRAILDGLAWLGLDYDEGPFYQTQRLERYREVIQQMINAGSAYRCYCTKERLDEIRQKQSANKEKPRYDGFCRDRQLNLPNHPYVVRFKNPEQGIVSFNDQVHGTITFHNEEMDDLIIARSDGMPTYNFAVVVDDWDMRITHVIRGDDHINNTPRQINLLRALGAELPIYAHVPMILGPDGTKLSKRHGAVDVTQYRDAGYLPEALLNYLVRLGWAYGDQEIFSCDEMVELFDVVDVHKAQAMINPQKLLWLNQHYLKTLNPRKIADELKPHLAKLKIDDLTSGPNLVEVVKVLAERSHTLDEMAEKSVYFYQDFANYEETAKKHLQASLVPIFQELVRQFAQLEDWTAKHLHQLIFGVAEKFALKLGKIAQPLRVAITGGEVSPPIDITLELIGKNKTIARLNKALDFIS